MTDAQAPIATSPLAEADPRSLEELMSRDPLKLTKQDRGQIVGELRRMREVWAKAEAAAPSRGKKAASAPVAAPTADDLGI